jgi:hypothetical protein
VSSFAVVMIARKLELSRRLRNRNLRSTVAIAIGRSAEP